MPHLSTLWENVLKIFNPKERQDLACLVVICGLSILRRTTFYFTFWEKNVFKLFPWSIGWISRLQTSRNLADDDINNWQWAIQSVLTILYWISSICARSEYRSNIEIPSPKSFAFSHWMIGCSCLWSPMRTTWFASEPNIPQRVSASIHIPHSSMMHCVTKPSHDEKIRLLYVEVHVHRITSTPDWVMAHFSAFSLSCKRGKRSGITGKK